MAKFGPHFVILAFVLVVFVQVCFSAPQDDFKNIPSGDYGSDVCLCNCDGRPTGQDAIRTPKRDRELTGTMKQLQGIMRMLGHH